MGFCIKARDAYEAKLVLRELSGRLGLASVPSATLTLAKQLDDATAYIGHDDVEWKASNTPWGTPVTVAVFVEQYQGTPEINDLGAGYSITTALGRVNTNLMYEPITAKGLVNRDALIVWALERAVYPDAQISWSPFGGGHCLMNLNNSPLAVRKGTISEAKEFLKNHSSIFKELL